MLACVKTSLKFYETEARSCSNNMWLQLLLQNVETENSVWKNIIEQIV